MRMKTKLFSLKLTFLLVFMAGVAIAQPSFKEFKKKYKPHNELIAPDNKAVKLVSYMEASKVAGVMEEYVDDENKEMFTLLITSVKRATAGKIIDAMNVSKAAKGLNFMKANGIKILCGMFLSLLMIILPESFLRLKAWEIVRRVKRAIKRLK